MYYVDINCHINYNSKNLQTQYPIYSMDFTNNGQSILWNIMQQLNTMLWEKRQWEKRCLWHNITFLRSILKIHTYIWKVQPLDSKILTMVFPRWSLFSFPLGDFVFFFLLGCIMQIMMMEEKAGNNKQKWVFVFFFKRYHDTRHLCSRHLNHSSQIQS